MFSLAACFAILQECPPLKKRLKIMKISTSTLAPICPSPFPLHLENTGQGVDSKLQWWWESPSISMHFAVYQTCSLPASHPTNRNDGHCVLPQSLWNGWKTKAQKVSDMPKGTQQVGELGLSPSFTNCSVFCDTSTVWVGTCHGAVRWAPVLGPR